MTWDCSSDPCYKTNSKSYLSSREIDEDKCQLPTSEAQTFKMKSLVTVLFCLSLGILSLEARQKAGTIMHETGKDNESNHKVVMTTSLEE